MANNNHRKLAIVVGGGPAPGINGVISSVTIEAINQEFEVYGVYDGFKHLISSNFDPKNREHARRLLIPDGRTALPARRLHPLHQPHQPHQGRSGNQHGQDASGARRAREARREVPS